MNHKKRFDRIAGSMPEEIPDRPYRRGMTLLTLSRHRDGSIAEVRVEPHGWRQTTVASPTESRSGLLAGMEVCPASAYNVDVPEGMDDDQAVDFVLRDFTERHEDEMPHEMLITNWTEGNFDEGG